MTPRKRDDETPRKKGSKYTATSPLKTTKWRGGHENTLTIRKIPRVWGGVASKGAQLERGRRGLKKMAARVGGFTNYSEGGKSEAKGGKGSVC